MQNKAMQKKAMQGNAIKDIIKGPNKILEVTNK
jgi:hypothetical protein